ncbi:oxidoreductase [Ideonella dechloratans]|uniref:Oxidoreductase n=1 Tax=Ideonella dechloratans TaxID=36863 RepID=A0A643FHC2_IDEDE|nr:oxidoreductase-like domain-containing protein [Ideonella dechloratans]KAB0583949.1 oxidoreductase [Ideonella dechloratans]UFU12566.1 oxidoreductase-like domain-containing protein [Ideonella dechloratans]
MLIPDDALLAWNPADRAEAQALITAVQASAQRHSTELPEPPPEPTTCCGRGCIGCVWEGYYSALAYWRDEAVLRWAD